MDESHWTARDVPGQTGRIAVVTGANTGLGLATAKVLAARHATVVLACRDLGKAKTAVEEIKRETPDAATDLLAVDLASLDTVRAAAQRLHERYDHIDLLINNAGVMWTPKGRTVDGFETQLGINHLGHFALTGLLLDLLRDVEGARIVTVSSLLHRQGRINFTDLQFDRGYSRKKAYSQSKLANLMFAYHLQRRLDETGAKAISVAAHPGVVATDLVRHLPFPGISRAMLGMMFQEPALGALPTLRAATDPAVTGGQFYGPDGPGQSRGYPVLVMSSEGSHARADKALLWTESEELTAVTYQF